MVEIDMSIHDIINEPDGITFVGRHSENVKILMNEQEKQLLKERLSEQV